MLTRALAATLAFAVLLTIVLASFQDTTFEPEHFFWALLFSAPVGLSVFLGGLGTLAVQAPSASLATAVFWIVLMAPSFILEERFRHLGLYYSHDSVVIGRWLFVVWSSVFVLVVGRSPNTPVRIVPKGYDFIAVSVPVGIAVIYLLVRGRFTNYQGVDTTVAASSDLVLAMSVGKNTLVCMPGFFLFLSQRAQSPTTVLASRLAILPSVLLLLLTGGRSGIAYAAGIVFFFTRLSGKQLRLRWAIPVVVSVPLLFLIVFTYRSGLGDVEGTASLGDLTSVASSTTAELATADDRRQHAVTNFSDNLVIRLGMGPQFFAVVEYWMDHGPALEGSFLDGTIRTLPSLFFPWKNDLASTYTFETLLQRTGRFPDVDLAPTPWMQWLYEFGLLGIVLGAAFYGALVRLLERRVLRTSSCPELLFMSYILASVFAAESTTDMLVLTARDGLVIVLAAALIAYLIGDSVKPRTADLGPAPPSPRIRVKF